MALEVKAREQLDRLRDVMQESCVEENRLTELRRKSLEVLALERARTPKPDEEEEAYWAKERARLEDAALRWASEEFGIEAKCDMMATHEKETAKKEASLAKERARLEDATLQWANEEVGMEARYEMLAKREHEACEKEHAEFHKLVGRVVSEEASLKAVGHAHANAESSFAVMKITASEEEERNQVVAEKAIQRKQQAMELESQRADDACREAARKRDEEERLLYEARQRLEEREHLDAEEESMYRKQRILELAAQRADDACREAARRRDEEERLLSEVQQRLQDTADALEAAQKHCRMRKHAEEEALQRECEDVKAQVHSERRQLQQVSLTFMAEEQEFAAAKQQFHAEVASAKQERAAILNERWEQETIVEDTRRERNGLEQVSKLRVAKEHSAQKEIECYEHYSERRNEELAAEMSMFARYKEVTSELDAQQAQWDLIQKRHQEAAEEIEEQRLRRQRVEQKDAEASRANCMSADGRAKDESHHFTLRKPKARLGASTTASSGGLKVAKATGRLSVAKVGSPATAKPKAKIRSKAAPKAKA